MTYDLSVIIPARNEEWLSRTVESVFTAARAKTECVVVLDGSWANPPLEQREHLTIIHHNVSIGQRAAINEAVRLSKSKYVMKLDAHCSVGEDFDEKLISVHQPDWVQVPLLYNFRVWLVPNAPPTTNPKHNVLTYIVRHRVVICIQNKPMPIGKWRLIQEKRLTSEVFNLRFPLSAMRAV